jgi:hypothetical protein
MAVHLKSSQDIFCNWSINPANLHETMIYLVNIHLKVELSKVFWSGYTVCIPLFPNQSCLHSHSW